MDEQQNAEGFILAKMGVDSEGNSEFKEPIFLTMSSYKNAKYMDIRKYYSDNGEWKPTKKGVTLNLDQISILKKVLNERSEEIEKWFK